ncbi:MAG TPA: hypothetical protein VKE22_13150 [Haliangiales bacterium]|nr:hypothetical protein [Haliangiales bacterium]
MAVVIRDAVPAALPAIVEIYDASLRGPGQGEILVVPRARKNGISHDCAGALKAALRHAKDRVERLRATLGRSR